MRKEYIYQLVLWAIYLITLLFRLHHDNIELTSRPLSYFGLALYHGSLFWIINYILIPRYLHTKKIVLFILILTGVLIFFGIIEESVIEKLLLPKTRGSDALSISGIYIFFGEILVPLSLFALIKLILDNFENQKRIATIEKDSLHNELKFLRSQIQPHILFNSLNSLYEYTLSKSEKAPDLVLQLSKVLRYVLYETDKDRILLKKEIQFLREYVALQEVQLENRGKVYLNIELKNIIDNLSIAPFLLIPFIENSFKHSLNSMEDDILIEIDLSVTGQNLMLNVSNTFEKVIRTNNDLIESGIGLGNVKKRLRLLYPESHSLGITENNKRYEIYLELNLL